MKTAFALLLAALGLHAQVMQQVMLAGGTDVPNAPVDSNSGGGCTGSSGAWTCTGSSTITLTDASAALIYYTTNGTTPNCAGTGTLYSAPFTSPGSTFTLKAIGCNGITGGGVLTSVYTITTALSYVHSAAFSPGFNATTTCPVTITAGTTGNLLASTVWWQSSSVTVTSVSDGTNTYTAVDSIVNGGDSWSGQDFYAKNISGSPTTVTANFSGSVNRCGIVVHEVSGANTSTPLDTHNKQRQASPGHGADAVSSGSFTTGSNGEYVFGATMDVGSNNDTVSAGTGFTIRAGSSTGALASEEQIQSSAGAISATFTDTTNFPIYYTFGMSFKP